MENNTILKNFGILYRTFLNYISKAIVSKDLSFSDSVFLINIGENEGVSQEEIADSLAIDKAAVARSVKTMERKGYITTKRSFRDKRAKELYLSETGRELFQYAMNLNGEWLKQILANLDPDKISSFAKIIGEISGRAKKIRQPGIDSSPARREADDISASH
jgi:DNA-binding MarR family transcriptional regulator